MLLGFFKLKSQNQRKTAGLSKLVCKRLYWIQKAKLLPPKSLIISAQICAAYYIYRSAKRLLEPIAYIMYIMSPGCFNLVTFALIQVATTTLHWSLKHNRNAKNPH